MSYSTRTQMLQAFANLETQYPGYVSHEVLGQSWGGPESPRVPRDILLYKIGNPSGGKVWLQGCTHGGEIVGPECYLLYAKWLLENQEPGISDRILNRNYTLICPMMNIDGYPDNNGGAGPVPLGPSTEGRRDNRNPSGAVNLNRNYPKSWRSDAGHYDSILAHWVGEPVDANGNCTNTSYSTKIGRDPIFYCYKSGAACSWTDVPGDWEYRGSNPGSEPETQVILAGVAKWMPDFFLEYHQWAGPYLCKSKYATGTTEGTAGYYHKQILDAAKALATSRGTSIVHYTNDNVSVLSEGVCGAVLDSVYDITRKAAFMTENPGPYDATNCCDRLKDYATWVPPAFAQFLPLAITFSQICEVIVVELPFHDDFADLSNWIIVSGTWTKK